MLAFLAPYWSKIIIVLVIFAAGVGAGIRYETPKIAKLNQELGGDKAVIASLTAGVTAQNDAINKLQSDAKIRADEAKKAINEALIVAADANLKAEKILASRPPKGKNVCAAASAAFDAELKAERTR